MALNCWHCHNDFEYIPVARLQDKPSEYFQGSTVCRDCVPCMGHSEPCVHEGQ